MRRRSRGPAHRSRGWSGDPRCRERPDLGGSPAAAASARSCAGGTAHRQYACRPGSAPGARRELEAEAVGANRRVAYRRACLLGGLQGCRYADGNGEEPGEMIGEGSMLKRGLVGCGIVVVAASMGCRAAPPPVDARILTDWMRAQYALVRAERLSPPVASRVFAYGAVALYEAVAAGSPRLRSLVGQLNELNELPRPQPRERYDWTIVTVSAETTLLKVLFKEGLPATQVAIAQLGDSQIAARRASRPVRDRATAYGAALGRAIADWATGDRFSETRGLAWKPPQGRG